MLLLMQEHSYSNSIMKGVLLQLRKKAEHKPPRVYLRWLMPTLFSWPASFIYLGYIAALLSGFAPSAPGTSWWQIFLLIGAVLTLLLMDRVEYWRYGEQVLSRSQALALLLIRLVLTLLVILLDGLSVTNLHVAPALYLLLPYFVMIYFGKKAGYGMAGLVSIAYIVEQWWFQPDWQTNSAAMLLTFLFFFGILLVVFLAQAISQEKAIRLQEQASRMHAEALLAEVTRSHLQLQDYAEQVATLATVEERNRLAREIHDSLGHALIAISIQLEKALVYHDRHPQEAVRAISDARQVTKEALQDVRHSVQALRTEPEPFSCVQSITLLVEQLRANGLKVEFALSGSENSFPRQALTTLYRVAQEGFTNIQKHAQASTIQVGLLFTDEEARLNISDDGTGFDVPQKFQQLASSGQGYGLQGIRERLELVDGNFHLESLPDRGTRLSATISKSMVSSSLLQKIQAQTELQ